MKEFIDKLIERLEGQIFSFEERLNYDSKTQKQLIIQNNSIKRAISIVTELAEEYKGGWIPLTKQLPEYGQYVLACVPPKDDINGGHPVVIMEFREDNESLFYGFVSAWMPLPPAWKGDLNGKA